MSSEHHADAHLTGTSVRIRGAIGGDAADLEWTVARLQPLLVQQAKFRLRGRLQHVCDPEDVVAHAWQVTLPRLSGLLARDGRYTPVLLKFLSTAVLLRVNELLRAELRRRPAASQSVGALPDRAPGVATVALRREREHAVDQALQELEPIDREVIVLRVCEQRSAAAAGAMLGVEAGAVHVRLHRALRRLRDRLPESVFDDLEAETREE